MAADDTALYNCTEQLLNATWVWQLSRSALLEQLDVQLRGDTRKIDSLIACVQPQTPPYRLPWFTKLFWIVLFAGMLIAATGGNIIVMWIVLAHRRMRTVTNYFLVNLSLSDLLMASLNGLFNFIFMVNSDWPFGLYYCTVNNFVANMTVASSVFTLMAICIDRYMAIVRPLQHRMSRRRARVALLLIWMCSAVLAVPCLIYSTTMTRTYADGQRRRVCYLLWPDGSYPSSMMDYVYNVIFLCLTYAVPVVAMAVCYTLMGRALWGSAAIGEQTQRQLESVRSKRKVVRMFIIVFTIFALCWLPYHGYFIYVYHNNAVAASHYVQHMYLAFYWLAMSNAMVNPFIYFWMNNRFRVYFSRALARLICCPRLARKEDLKLAALKRTASHSDLLARSRSVRHWAQSHTSPALMSQPPPLAVPPLSSSMRSSSKPMSPARCTTPKRSATFNLPPTVASSTALQKAPVMLNGSHQPPPPPHPSGTVLMSPLSGL